MDILENSGWNNLCLTQACRDRKEMELETDRMKAEALISMANQPAQKTSPLLYLIPVAGILVIGVIVIIAKKKRK